MLAIRIVLALLIMWCPTLFFFGQKYPRTLEKDLASICQRCHIDKPTLKDFLNKNYDTWDDFARHFMPEFVSEVQATVARRYPMLYQDNATALSDLNRCHPSHFTFEQPYDTMPKCRYCGCWFFKGEGFGSLKCCHDGILPTRVKPLQSMPTEYREMLLYDVDHFRRHLRALNTCLSFSSIGVKYGQFEHLGHPSCIRVSGKLYHRMLHAEADGPLRYYVHDPMFEGRSDVVHPTTSLGNDMHMLKAFGMRTMCMWWAFQAHCAFVQHVHATELIDAHNGMSDSCI